MRILASATVVFLLAALPCAAEDYYGVMATAKHGNGYQPATIVAGWEKKTSFQVLSFVRNGQRTADKDLIGDWKVVLITGPKAPPKDDDFVDERYQDRRAPALKTPDEDDGPPVVHSEATYAALTCPALLTQMAALKPLTGFGFDLPDLKGVQDGPNGDGHGGFDLWVRVGDDELSKSAGTAQSKLGQWFRQTTAALAACPKAP